MMQTLLNSQALTPRISTMVHKSQHHLLAGKTVVALGGGNYGKRHLWTEARELGVKLVLVDSDPDHPARAVVDTLLHVDIRDHTQDEQHVHTILHLLSERLPGREVAGCITWLEDTVPLTGLLGQALGLPHAMSVEAALNAKSKERTHVVLGQQVLGSPHNPEPPAVYASPVVKVNSVDEVAEAVQKISLPAVMKLGFGSGSVGVKHVYSIQEAEQHLTKVQETLRKEPDFPGLGVGYGNSMILMPSLVGTEHDVDIVMYQSHVVAAFVSDNGPTHVPLCMPTTTLMPSVLPKEHKQELIRAVAACCRGLGLHTGVFSVEMMMTPQGLRLLEVNARMGGDSMRDWIRLLYNVDLFHLALMCACGIRPVLPGRASSLGENLKDHIKASEQEENRELSNGYLMGVMLYPSRHAQSLTTIASPQHLQDLHQKGDVVFSQFRLETAPSGTTFEKSMGLLAVQASSLHEAKSKLISVCTSLGLETKESLQEMLPNFVNHF